MISSIRSVLYLQCLIDQKNKVTPSQLWCFWDQFGFYYETIYVQLMRFYLVDPGNICQSVLFPAGKTYVLSLLMASIRSVLYNFEMIDWPDELSHSLSVVTVLRPILISIRIHIVNRAWYEMFHAFVGPVYTTRHLAGMNIYWPYSLKCSFIFLAA